MKKLLLFATLIISAPSCVNTVQINEKRRIQDSLTQISDSLVRDFRGFAYLKMGATYKQIAAAAKTHHKPYMQLFKSQYKYLPEYAQYNYPNEYGYLQTVYLKDILIAKPKIRNRAGVFHSYKDNPEVTETEGAMMLSENIIVNFSLLFFRDSLVEINFESQGKDFARKAIEKKYGIGKIYSDIYNPGIKTDIHKCWENDNIKAEYHNWVEYEKKNKELNIKSAGSYFTIKHKGLSTRLREDSKAKEDIKKATQKKEQEDAMDSI